MKTRNKKGEQPLIPREVEIASAQFFGKHISQQKRKLLLCVTLIACAMPMVMGVRLWDEIPLTVKSGLIGLSGEDDSMPRWAVVFGLPGLMCTLNLITHLQLWRYQEKMMLPPPKFRLLGRWGFPILSVIFCTGMIRQSLSLVALPLFTLAPSIIGLLFLVLGGQMWDCSKDAVVSLRLPRALEDDASWKAVHRFASILWMTAGLIVIANIMIFSSLPPVAAGFVLAVVSLPILFGAIK